MRTLILLLVSLTVLLTADPASANQSEAAHELYQKAQELIQSGRFRQAERDFGSMLVKYPNDSMAGEAMYWRAFALYRLGNEDEDREDLAQARDVLMAAIDGKGAATTTSDARALLTRVEGQLAALGDREAAQRTRNRADADEDDDLKMAALNALIQMDSERAVPILKKILQNPDQYPKEMREQAVFLIAQHGDAEATQILIEIARSNEEPEIRENAIFWLSQVDSDETIGVLESILKEEKDPDLQEQAIFAISQHDSPESARLLKEIAVDTKYDEELRANAIFWLGQQSSADFGFLRELYTQLESKELKDKILFAASQQQGKEQAEFLSQVLHDKKEDPELRQQALFWLGQSGMLDMKGLLELYDSMEDRELREQAIFAISQQGGQDGVDALLHIARTEKDRELKQNAIFWLGQMDDERAAELLEEIIAGGGQ